MFSEASFFHPSSFHLPSGQTWQAGKSAINIRFYHFEWENHQSIRHVPAYFQHFFSMFQHFSAFLNIFSATFHDTVKVGQRVAVFSTPWVGSDRFFAGLRLPQDGEAVAVQFSWAGHRWLVVSMPLNNMSQNSYGKWL